MAPRLVAARGRSRQGPRRRRVDGQRSPRHRRSRQSGSHQCSARGDRDRSRRKRLARRIEPLPAVVVVFATGPAVGFINGFLVVKMKLNAFIATPAMLIPFRGITMGMTDGKTLFSLPEEYLYLGRPNGWKFPSRSGRPASSMSCSRCLSVTTGWDVPSM